MGVHDMMMRVLRIQCAVCNRIYILSHTLLFFRNPQTKIFCNRYLAVIHFHTSVCDMVTNKYLKISTMYINVKRETNTNAVYSEALELKSADQQLLGLRVAKYMCTAPGSSKFVARC